MKALLVNPWISDFAAYNFWIRPLGLYRLASWLDSFDIKVSIIDCLSPFRAPGKFKRKPVEFPLKGLGLNFDRSFARYGISRNEFRKRLSTVGGFDVVFITSIMSYWYPGVKWTIEEIKRQQPNVPIVLGGIYATLWPEHARKNLEIDLLCEGPLELNEESLMAFLGLDRKRHTPKAWYKVLSWDRVNYGAIRTAIGCPFSCSYCASRLLTGGFKPQDYKEVLKEILFLYKKGVRQIAFYDDALLVDFKKRLLSIFEYLEKKSIRLEFHTPNGLHARFIDEEVARWLYKANFKTIRLSLETISQERQQKTGGKVSNKDFKRAVALLLDAGVKREYIGAYLLIGLPGQDLEEVEKGVRFVKSLGIRPYLAEFSPIPKTLEWERLKKDGVLSDDIDPLLTNNTIFFRLFSGYNMEKIKKLKVLAREN